MNEFDKTCLKKAETAEKNPLPSSEAIAQEMEHIKFKVQIFSSPVKISSHIIRVLVLYNSCFQVGIEMFDKTKLSHTETLVKDVLPTQEIIALEKSQ